MNCYSTTDRPTKEYLQRFSDLCELANGIPYLVDQYRQADDAASQWYEIAKSRKRQADEAERLRTALTRISLCSQNSMSSKEDCGRIAREALKREEE
jgi:hypothetical protein